MPSTTRQPNEMSSVTQITPNEDDVVEAIQTIWRKVRGSFSTMGDPKLLQSIKQDHPEWVLNEEQLKDIKERGLAAEHLREPTWYAGKDYRPDQEYVRSLDEAYVSAVRWAECMPAEVGELSGTFEITSGELTWGQMRGLAGALKTTRKDLPGADRKEEVPGTVVQSFGMYFRAPAKNGTWKVAVVEGAGRRDHKSGWIAYHISCDPLSMLKAARLVDFSTRTSNPHITYVNRYDWSYYGPDHGQLERTLADLDPETWSQPFDRKRSLWLEGGLMNEYHEDCNMWERIDKFQSAQCFLLDATGTASVLKLMARPSDFDTRVIQKKSSSLFFPPSNAAEVEVKADKRPRPFGCNLSLHPYGEYEVARLMFCPNEDELVAFWYDTAHYSYNSEELAVDPFFEDV